MPGVKKMGSKNENFRRWGSAGGNTAEGTIERKCPYCSSMAMVENQGKKSGNLARYKVVALIPGRNKKWARFTITTGGGEEVGRFRSTS